MEFIALLGEGDFLAALGLLVEEGEGIELVLVVFAKGLELGDEGGGAFAGIGVPLGADELVEGVLVDGLEVRGAGLDDEVDDGSGERFRGSGDEFVAGLAARAKSPGSVPSFCPVISRARCSMASPLMEWKRSFVSWFSEVPPNFSAMASFCSGLSMRSMRARRPAREETVSASVAPMTTSMAMSLNGTEGLVMGGRLAVFRDFVTPMASTIT